ncbi:MAG: DUF4276 family protein [Defluviitaleaceae bacterium]|nr:DUF4276 family protein [Defluviitaleaceae bacterium]MCL2238428.1 DUF4276 family protein [Defluviitaleaceae bacterium]
MHFEFLVEDASGKKAMEVLAPKLLGDTDTFRIFPYKGNGHLPKGLKPKTDARKRILLDQLPKLINGYGRTPDCGVIVIICDLDSRDYMAFMAQLESLLNSCTKKPKDTLFCLAVEEFEAWYLGDLAAIRKAYPNAKEYILNRYENDSICGTWELLADAIYKGGRIELSKKGQVGVEKYAWAEKISPFMDVSKNASPSFNEMRKQLHSLKSKYKGASL